MCSMVFGSEEPSQCGFEGESTELYSFWAGLASEV